MVHPPVLLRQRQRSSGSNHAAEGAEPVAAPPPRPVAGPGDLIAAEGSSSELCARASTSVQWLQNPTSEGYGEITAPRAPSSTLATLAALSHGGERSERRADSHRVSLCLMQNKREPTVELEPEHGGEESAPIRVAPDDLQPDTLRAVIESFVLREGTDYGAQETPLEVKVAQVLTQLRRGEAHITFDPASESVNVVVTRAIAGTGRPDRCL